MSARFITLPNQLTKGRNAMTLFPLLAAAHPGNETYAALEAVGPVMYGSSLVTGLMLWGLGIWWLFHAVVTVLTHYLTYEMAFNVSGFVSPTLDLVYDSFILQMGAWGVTFPLGSLALLTFSLGTSFDSLFFKCVPRFIVILPFFILFAESSALG